MELSELKSSSPGVVPELLDQKIAFRITEPLEFEAEHSSGPFAGRVSAVQDEAVVIALETPVVFRGEKIIQLVATPRFERDRLTTASLVKGTAVTFIPVTQLDIAEIGDNYKIAASRRRWVLSGDLMLAAL